MRGGRERVNHRNHGSLEQSLITSAPIGAWEVKLDIMTERPTDKKGQGFKDDHSQPEFCLKLQLHNL